MWADFARTTGLYDFFYDKKKGLLREHPGRVRMRRYHLKTIQAAVEVFRETHPKARPVFGNEGPDGEIYAHYARLLWLEWWFQWSLDNLTNPHFYNS